MELNFQISLKDLTQFLQKKGWINKTEKVQKLERPGEGNMNVVMRVITTEGSMILKQSRDFVNKYPDIPAPVTRIEVEHEFYKFTAKIGGMGQYQPKVLQFDKTEHLMMMEDLGPSSDLTSLYQKGTELDDKSLNGLMEFARLLHGSTTNADLIGVFPSNMGLKKLNHEHIFVFPFLENNGFDLDAVQQGLQSVATTYKKDSKLKSQIAQLGERYLKRGPVLIHGDYYPGSWLDTASGIKVIDPEFGFFGLAEFDMAVMKAHLRMAQQEEKLINGIVKKYALPLDVKLLQKFEGVEIMRRIIGLAQLPLDLSLEERTGLLQLAYQLIVEE